MCLVKAFALWACIVLCSFGRSWSGIASDRMYANLYRRLLAERCSRFSNSSADLEQLCGYSYTAKFRHSIHFTLAARATRSILQLVGNCSPYARDIVCSVYLPRCDPYIRGPFLPCRRVCDEFEQKCAPKIARHGLEWIIGMCQLLPRVDDPQTTLGYLGRCFEPIHFRTNITVASEPQDLTCHPLVVPICQNLGYTQTVLPPDKQRAYERYTKGKLEQSFPGDNNTDCPLNRKRFFCTENFPACIDNQLAFFCRDRCFEFFEKNCSSVFFYEKNMCIEFPEGTSKVNICKQTHWPRAENWPNITTKVPHSSKAPDHVTTQVTTAPDHVTTQVTIGGGSKTTLTPTGGVGKTTPTESGGHPGIFAHSRSDNSYAKAGGVIAGVCFILLVAVAACLVYRKKRISPFAYEKQILYTKDSVDM